MRLILHIGLEKTGSTALQEYLYDNNEKLNQHGFSYISTSIVKNARHLATWSMSDSSVDDHTSLLRINTSHTRERWKNEFELYFERLLKHVDNCNKIHTVILSSEHLHSRLKSSKEVRRLNKLLSPYFSDIEVLMYIRRQDRMAVSLYSTMCLSGGTRSQIFDKSLDKESHYYNFYKIYMLWKNSGFESIIVRNYDLLNDNNIISDFLKTYDIHLNYDERIIFRNRSLSNQAVKYLLKYNHLVQKIDSKLLNRIIIEIRMKLSKRLKILYDGRGKLPSQKEAKKFHEMFHESNNQLVELIGNKTDLFDTDYSDYPLTQNDEHFSFLDGFILLRLIFISIVDLARDKFKQL